jgi:glutamate racemase
VEEHLRQVGVFDSGVGGLSVWREIRRALPQLHTVYVADQAHIPYGPLPPATVLEYSRQIVLFLEQRGCEVIVIACNTASAAALHILRDEMPHLEFIGMEPAIKPAAQRSGSGVVVVLATATTLAGRLFQETSRKFASQVRVVAQPCPGLVEQIERGETDTPATRELLRMFLEQPLLAGADTCVLGCTHYAFVRPLLEELLPEQAQIIDPAPAIAQRVQRLLGEEAAIPTPTTTPGQAPVGTDSRHEIWTSGPLQAFVEVASRLLAQDMEAHQLIWGPDGLRP